ncbi:MAG: hypothetical protein NC483_00665 [Ruminococcus sp.]|nr:hypothetical protein [Ruminococcus sp.]
MNITSEQVYTVFRNDFNGYTFYKMGISKKSQTGEWINGYIRCQFKNGVSVENKTKIKLKRSWLSFYNKDKETIPYVFIADFEIVNTTGQQNTQQITDSEQQTQEDPFASFGEEVIINEEDLPF